MNLLIKYVVITIISCIYVELIGYNAALVGTSLMKTGNPGTALAELLNRVPS